MGSIGETLRQARIDKGVSLVEAERATFIRHRYLEALEQDDTAALPALVYTRGFIRTYAEYLGLNPQSMLDLHQPPRHRDAPPRLRPMAQPPAKGQPLPLMYPLVVGGAVLAVLLLLYLRTDTFNPESGSSLAGASATGVATRAGLQPGALISPGALLRTPSPGATAEPTVADLTPTPIEGVLVVAVVSGDTWVEAWVDGESEFAEIVEGGERKTLQGSQSVRLRIADAAAVSVTVNGEQQAPLGADGQAVEASWSR